MRITTAVAALLALAACASPAPDNTTDTGITTQFRISDDPFPYARVARVDLYVVSLSVSVNPDTSATAAGDFVTVASPHRAINLLALQGGLFESLGQAQLPHGAITAVRLVIDTDSSSITLRDGRVLSALTNPAIQWQSSAGRPVLNAFVPQQIVLPDTGAIVSLDFDVGRAFITPQTIDPSSTDSGFVFSPVFNAFDATRSGSVSGNVHGAGGPAVADASARLYFGDAGAPSGTWSLLSNARSGTDGNFKFPLVLPSAYWSGTALAGGTYIVVVDAPAGSTPATATRSNLTVTSGSNTDVGTVTLP